MADQTMPAPGNPLHQSGLCLLSLDGGGVRGLSTLLILKALMAKINAERRKDGQPEVKPCELFDMIGGTSTGGIIAIMLGRLEMSVDECIATYTRMFEIVFGKKGLPVSIRGKIKGRFDSIVLEECIVDILKERGLPKDELLNNDKGCRVVVCAKAAEIGTTVLFRSYTSSESLNNIRATICEAARATSAATSFFDPVTIGRNKRKFVDGALGANNPVDQIWNEAQNVWCADDVDLKDMLKCMVSLGTGNPGLKPISEGVLKLFTESLLRIAVETEDTAKRFIARNRQLYEQKRYFRFNVQQGLQDVGLEEYKKTALIEATTADYMDIQGTKSASKECAMNLKQKQSYSIVLVESILKWREEQTKAQRKPRPFTFMPLPRNGDFIHRSVIFERLSLLLPQNTSCHMAAIWGLGGSGKTQVALEYAYTRQIKTSCSIFWVRADNESRFTQNYTEIARMARLPPDLKGEDLLVAVRQWIEQQGNWLLVLDNVDNLGIFKKSYNKNKINQQNPELLRFVPNGHGGSVIWTSRDGSILGKIVGPNQGIEVRPMDDHEAIKLFQKLSGHVENQELVDEEKVLVNLLEHLPLAISQAAAYIRKTKISTQNYIKILTESETRQVNVLSTEFDEIYRSDIPNSVMTTWLISMKQISEESPNAEKILNTISFLDNQGLPFKLLRAAVSDLSEDEALLAAGRLVEYAFLQVQKVEGEEPPAYEQHRLVQLAARHALNDEQTRIISGKALEIIAEIFPNGTHETWTDCRLYLPHALKATVRKNAEGFIDRAPDLLTHIGHYYWGQGRSDEAEKLNVEVLELRQTVLGERHPDTIRAMANLASTWWQQGRSDEAEKLYIEVLELQITVLGERHPNTIRAMVNLASTWWQQGRSDEAEKLEVEVLELRKTVLGERHPDTILAMANLASTWQQQSRSDEAEKLEVEVLELRKTVLGERHPDTIRAMANLASTWRQQGRSDEAEKLEVEVLELRKTVLGERHPDTIRAMANLASIWRQQGRSDEAEKLEVEVLELLKTVLGERHPDTIRAMANLASTWWQQGRSDEAEKLYIEVLELLKTVLGERHPDTILAMANLASTWWQQGRSDEAEKLYIEVLELQKTMLGERHPDTILAMANLASTWWQQGRSDEAEKLYIEVLELRQTVLGERHPDTILAMANLASTWRQQGRSDEAEKLEVEVLELRKTVLGERHPDTILAMANLASTWWQQGRSDEAEKLEVEVLELRKTVLGERHPDTILAMANLASTWWQQGRSDEAEKLEVEVLKLRKTVLGERHPDTILAMANLASTWWQQDRFNEAEKLEVKVLELRKTVLGETHPDTILAIENLEITRESQVTLNKPAQQTGVDTPTCLINDPIMVAEQLSGISHRTKMKGIYTKIRNRFKNGD